MDVYFLEIKSFWRYFAEKLKCFVFRNLKKGCSKNFFLSEISDFLKNIFVSRWPRWCVRKPGDLPVSVPARVRNMRVSGRTLHVCYISWVRTSVQWPDICEFVWILTCAGLWHPDNVCKNRSSQHWVIFRKENLNLIKLIDQVSSFKNSDKTKKKVLKRCYKCRRIRVSAT